MKINLFDIIKAFVKKILRKTSKTKYIHGFVYDFDFFLYCKAVSNNLSMGGFVIETGGRCSGKTTRAINISALTGMPILMQNQLQVKFIKRQAQEMGLFIPEPLSWSSRYSQFDGSGSSKIAMNKGLIVDEAQNILNEVLHNAYRTGERNYYIFSERKV